MDEVFLIDEVRTLMGWCLGLGIVMGYALACLQFYLEERKARRDDGWEMRPLPTAVKRPRRSNRRVAVDVRGECNEVCLGGNAYYRDGVAICGACKRPLGECLRERPGVLR